MVVVVVVVVVVVLGSGVVVILLLLVLPLIVVPLAKASLLHARRWIHFSEGGVQFAWVLIVRIWDAVGRKALSSF